MYRANGVRGNAGWKHTHPSTCPSWFQSFISIVTEICFHRPPSSVCYLCPWRPSGLYRIEMPQKFTSDGDDSCHSPLVILLYTGISGSSPQFFFSLFFHLLNGLLILKLTLIPCGLLFISSFSASLSTVGRCFLTISLTGKIAVKFPLSHLAQIQQCRQAV